MVEPTREDHLLELLQAMMDARENIEQVMIDVEEAIEVADECDGEIKRVVGGQLRAYLLDTLKSFYNEGTQPGNLPRMMEIVEEEIERTENQEEREEHVKTSE